jgi:serine/threonine-protein kinase RsbW
MSGTQALPVELTMFRSRAGPAPVRRTRVFPGEPGQLSVLRRWLESVLPESPARHDVACVATELGSNAVRHTTSGAGGRFTVTVVWYGPVVRVAVADGGAAGGPRMTSDPLGEHGRGLLVVRAMSVGMGVCGDRGGRLVWADVPWGTGRASPPAPAFGRGSDCGTGGVARHIRRRDQLSGAER